MTATLIFIMPKALIGYFMAKKREYVTLFECNNSWFFLLFVGINI